jgi:hypothetical protein
VQGRNILLFADNCATHPYGTSFLHNVNISVLSTDLHKHALHLDKIWLDDEKDVCASSYAPVDNKLAHVVFPAWMI